VFTRLRILILSATLAPVFAVAIGSLFVETLAPLFATLLALGGAAIALGPVLILCQDQVDLETVSQQVRQALERDEETKDALVLPLEAIPPRCQGSCIAQLVTEYGTRLSQRRVQLRACMSAMMKLFGELADSRLPIPNCPELDSPDRDDWTLLNGSYLQFAQSLLKTRRRAKEFAGFLRELPQAIIVTDGQYKIVSVNDAAELLIGRPARQLQAKPLNRFFADPAFLEDAERYAGRIVPLEEALKELMEGRAEECLTALHGPQGKIQCVALQAKFGACHSFSLRLIKSEQEHLDEQNGKAPLTDEADLMGVRCG
jgi:PAS domain-containing protein